MGPRIPAAPRTAPPNFWMAPPCPLGFPAPETRWIPEVCGPSLAEGNPLQPPVLRPAIRAASLGGSIAAFSTSKKRMGWDLNPRTTFAVAGFQEQQRPSGTPDTNTLENQGKSLLMPLPPRRRATGPRGEIEPNRATTSQTETTHQTSQRQVTDGVSRKAWLRPSGTLAGIRRPSPETGHPVRKKNTDIRCRADSASARLNPTSRSLHIRRGGLLPGLRWR